VIELNQERQKRMKKLFQCLLAAGACTLAVATQAQNQVSDPGFEASGPMLAYDFGNFAANPLNTWLNVGFGPQYLIDPNATDQVHGGSQSMKLTATGITDDANKWEMSGAKQIFAVTPGEVVNGSAWLRWQGLTGVIESHIEAKWLKADGSEFGAGEVPQPGIGTATKTAGSGGWEFQDLSTWSVAQRTAPAGAAFVDFRLTLLSPGGADTATGTVWWDDATFTVVPEPSTYGMLGAGLAGMLGLLGWRKRKV